ncbi:hypothetical protein [Terrisporobacter petrolearius]|uniref:hypothetical protein n=1 Tax=Terrisporobacter petrolearius TaxID=1460447 RepID=UPI0031CC4330
MSNRKIIGLFIISQALLTLVLVIMLGQIAFHLDKLDGSFVDNIMSFYPSVVYIIMIGVFSVGVYIFCSKK